MRQHESSSQNLKSREFLIHCPFLCALSLRVHAVRFSLKDLEKDFEKTEDDIKAVQSVGQIIGEVMKQLDDERCASLYPTNPRYPVLTLGLETCTQSL